MNQRLVIETSWGRVGVEASDNAIVRFHLPDSVPEDFASVREPSALLFEAERQIAEYFSGIREAFDLPLEPAGSDFMQSVWQRLVLIPFGALQTYGDVANALGSPGASRAVGKACGSNPIPLLIPCHRVVGSKNKLTGFSSSGGVEMKRRLIEHEMGGLFAIRRKSKLPNNQSAPTLKIGTYGGTHRVQTDSNK